MIHLLENLLYSKTKKTKKSCTPEAHIKNHNNKTVPEVVKQGLLHPTAIALCN